MITIGVTGKIGAGKSTVARRFAELGADVIDADALAHEVLEEPVVRAALVKRFGAAVFTADGNIDRGRLATIVFGPTTDHAAALAALEAIVHPGVHRRIEASLADAREAERRAGRGDAVVVLDIPLLERSGWDKECDLVVTVECADDVRRERLARRGVNLAQQAARDMARESAVAGSGRSDPPAGRPQKAVTVDASGDLAYTLAQVDRIWGVLHGQ